MQEFQIILKNEKRKFYDRFAIFIFILAGLTTGAYLFRGGNTFLIYLAGILILLLILYSFIRKDLKVVINTNGIIYPSFPSKTIDWSFISNLILKDGLLTIDMKNNRII